MGMRRKPRSQRPGRTRVKKQDTKPAPQGARAKRWPGSPGGRERDRDAYLTAFVWAGGLNCRMAPLSQPLAGAKSHEACGQMARAGSKDPEGGKEGKLHSLSLY